MRSSSAARECPTAAIPGRPLARRWTADPPRRVRQLCIDIHPIVRCTGCGGSSRIGQAGPIASRRRPPIRGGPRDVGAMHQSVQDDMERLCRTGLGPMARHATRRCTTRRFRHARSAHCSAPPDWEPLIEASKPASASALRSAPRSLLQRGRTPAAASAPGPFQHLVGLVEQPLGSASRRRPAPSCPGS